MSLRIDRRLQDLEQAALEATVARLFSVIRKESDEFRAGNDLALATAWRRIDECLHRIADDASAGILVSAEAGFEKIIGVFEKELPALGERVRTAFYGLTQDSASTSRRAAPAANRDDA